MTVAGMRVASNEEDEGAGQATTRAMVAATTLAAMRVASDKEGEGGKAMETVTRLAGEQRRRQRRGQWQWQRGWRARMPWQTAPPWRCSFLGLVVDAPPFFSLPCLSWRERYVQNYVSAFCACGWGLVLSTKLLAGKVCFYVFMYLCTGFSQNLLAVHK